MNLWVLRPDEVPRNWGWLGQLLGPHNADATRIALEDGSLGAITFHGPGFALLVLLECRRTPGSEICWVYWVGGRTKGLRPKALARLAADIAAAIETFARKAKCTELRIKGRDWSFLPGFSRDGANNRIVKVLQ